MRRLEVSTLKRPDHAATCPPSHKGRAIAYDLEFLFCRPSKSWGPRPRTATTQQRVPGPQLSLGRQEKKATNAIAPPARGGGQEERAIGIAGSIATWSRKKSQSR